MTKIKKLVWLLTFLFATASLGTAQVGDYQTIPRLKKNGEKHRVAYIQGGPYYEYDQVFLAVILQLQKLGWIDNINLPTRYTANARLLFEFLSNNEFSKFIEFPKDAFYDANWKEERRLRNKQAIGKRTDIDMVFAFGTWAGKDMKKMPPEFQIPAVVMDVSDALNSEIVDSNEDSGRDNLTARVDPLRYQRQIAMFHLIFGFSRLGMAFEDTVEGRSYSAITEVEKVARQQGFTIVKQLHKGYVKDKAAAQKWLLGAIKKMVPKIDAFYITGQLAVDKETLPSYLKILNKNKIPTFSQSGSVEVRQGVLLSIATSNFRHVAAYHADKIAKILNGAKSRNLPILFEDPSKIAINLKTAQLIGFDPPVDILGAADEIYTD